MPSDSSPRANQAMARRTAGVTHIETWSEAHEVIQAGDQVSSEIACGILCAECGDGFKAGQYSRWRYGPHGGTAFHDDCTSARTGDEETVLAN
jgi:hypothetical protein